MNQKADRSDLIELEQVKSNKADIDLSWNFIETMHKQVQHISVILNEFLRVTVSQEPQSEKSRQGKLAFLA